MAGRRTNLALMVLLALALITGVAAYGIGVEWGRLVLVAHGVVAFAILLLTPWKSVIARRGLRRRRSGKAASVLLSVLVVIAVVFGVLHSTGVLISLGPLTSMQIHVGAALAVIPLGVWHVVARRVRVHHTDLSRRQALKAGALLGGAGVVYAAIDGGAGLAGLSGARRRFTGSHEQGSGEPSAMPVTQWLNDRVPSIDSDRWRLRLSARDSSTDMGYADLSGFDDRLMTVLDCTGGWYAEQEWEGAKLARLLDLRPDSWSFVVTSATGYRRRFPVAAADGILVATRVAGETLSAGHGFPARLVVPGRRGFWWVKWVVSIEESPRVPSWAQSPFPMT